MKISKYIELLKDIKLEHGDIEVHKYDILRDRIEAPPPQIDFVKILKKRESKPSFYCRVDEHDQKGEKVCRI